MIKLAHTERISINAYGRKRYLYGDSSKIERQALNTPIQGSSADTINQDIVLIYQELLKQGIKTKMALAVHDELIFECLDSELKQVYEIAKKIMKRERIINGHTFTIPIDSEIGKYWGSLSKFNEETMETIDGSKH
jgi:DNA polymerase-1